MPEDNKKTLGAAIDEIMSALAALPEGVRLTAVRAACEGVGVILEPLPRTTDDRSDAGPQSRPTGHTPPGPQADSMPQDIRSLKVAKNPKNNQEMACVMAYYLQHLAPTTERKTVVGAGDIEKYFAQAGFPLPKAPGQVLVDAKLAGYFDAVDRGTYKLNPVGHNLVVHGLPKQDLGSGNRSSRSSSARSAKKAASKKAR